MLDVTLVKTSDGWKVDDLQQLGRAGLQQLAVGR